jgi:hypothetical protein
MEAKNLEIKIRPMEWSQIGGDVNFEDYGLVIAIYNDINEEIRLVSIIPSCDGNVFIGEERTFTVDELHEIEPERIEIYGLSEKDLVNRGLEGLAMEEFTLYGGDPIQVGYGFDTRYISEFDTFDEALRSAIGDDYFIDFSNKKVRASTRSKKRVCKRRKRKY